MKIKQQIYELLGKFVFFNGGVDDVIKLINFIKLTMGAKKYINNNVFYGKQGRRVKGGPDASFGAEYLIIDFEEARCKLLGDIGKHNRRKERNI